MSYIIFALIPLVQLQCVLGVRERCGWLHCNLFSGYFGFRSRPRDQLSIEFLVIPESFQANCTMLHSIMTPQFPSTWFLIRYSLAILLLGVI
jgi:hypothetical protein